MQQGWRVTCYVLAESLKSRVVTSSKCGEKMDTARQVESTGYPDLALYS